MMGPGQIEEQKLRNNGFTDQEVSEWKSGVNDELAKAGFNQADISRHWGIEEPDMSATRDYVKIGLEAMKKAEQEKKTVDASVKPVPAENFSEAFTAGLQMSTAGLAISKPDIELGADATQMMKIAQAAGTLAGDIPAMLAGGFFGTMAGAGAGGAVGGLPGIPVGMGVGGYAGANALPQALRKIMMDHYEKGDIQTSDEFWTRVAATTWETMKAGTVGAVGFGAGKVVGPIAGNYGKTIAEMGSMVSVGAALEGHMPQASDFLTAGALVGGFHVAPFVAGKLRNVFTATGEKPAEIAQKLQQDVQLHQEILDSNPNLPVKDARFESVKLPDNVIDGPWGKDAPGTPPPQDAAFLKPGATPPATTPPPPVGPPSLKARGIEKANQLYTAIYDDLHPIKQTITALAEGTLKESKDPYLLMRVFRDYQGRVAEALHNNTYSFGTLKPNGEGLHKILKDITWDKKDALSASEKTVFDRIVREGDKKSHPTRQKLAAYLISKRALEFQAKGREIETGIDLNAARQVVAEGEARFGAAQKRIAEFQDRVLQYAVDSGVVSKKAAKAMRALNGDYVPFKRFIDDPLGGGGGESGSTGLKRIKGSESQIFDPLDTIIENTAMLYRAAEKNRALESLYELQQKASEGSPKLMEKAKVKFSVTDVSAEEITKHLQKLGMDIQDGELMDGMQVFRSGPKRLEKNEFPVFKDGKMSVIKTTPEIADAVRSLDFDSKTSNWFIRKLALPAQALRAGVTLHPEFMLKNAFRDQITATAQSKYGHIPFVYMGSAIKEIMGNSEAFQRFRSSGGMSASYREIAHWLEGDLERMHRETGIYNGVQNAIRHPLQFLGHLSEAIEQIPRFTEFKRAGGTAPDADINTILRGAFSARETTVDFSRAGTQLRGMGAYFPFMNAKIQGTDRFVRALKENPTGTLTKTAAAVTLPTVLLWMYNHKDSRYKRARDYEKDLFWLIPIDRWEKSTYDGAMVMAEDLRRQLPDGSWEVNNGPLLRLPKPFEVGIIFGSLVERSLNKIVADDPEAFHGFLGDSLGELIPDPRQLTAVAPFVEHSTNRRFFGGGQVVSQGVEKYAPEYQFMEYTSETAKAIGKLISFTPLGDLGPKDAKLSSPMVVDNYIRAWGGYIGRDVTRLMDKVLRATGYADSPEPPTSTLADIPFVQSFISRNPSAKLQPIETFRENYDRTQRALSTFKMLVSNQRKAEAAAYLADNKEDMINLRSINQQLIDLNRYIHAINKSKTTPPNDKRQLIDRMYYLMVQSAERGNELLLQHQKAVREIANPKQ